MKKCILALFAYLILNSLAAQELTVMTYNIRLDLASDGENAWDNRKDFLTAQIGFYAPDVFGVQEARPNQVADLARALPGYRFVGVGRDGNNTGEASNIFYKADRFAVSRSGTFWLSATPDTVSKGWDAAYNRICTYALFRDNKAKKQFWMFNTHLDNVGAVARRKGIELILSKIKQLNTTNLPVILTGDLNTEPGDSLLQYLRTQLTDAREASVQKPFGPSGTFNGFRHDKPVTQLIDYVFLAPKHAFVVRKYAVLSDAKDLKYPSDHLPVYVQLQYNR